MNSDIKIIAHPQFKDASKLTAVELNNIHFSGKHTVLTPEQLERIAAAYKNGKDTEQSD